MQQTYSTGKDNYENKKEPIKIMQINDPGHLALSGKPYLALERPGKQIAETKNNAGMILHDIFGALNY